MRSYSRALLALLVAGLSVSVSVAGDVTNLVDFAEMKADLIAGMGIPGTIAGTVFGILFLLGLAFKIIKKGKAG